MASVSTKVCVFGCSKLGAYMHYFPHPIKRSELFKKWVDIVGDKLRETEPMKIFKNKMVCDYHFTSSQKLRYHRLTLNAVPCLHLDGLGLSETISVSLEHNYCMPRMYEDPSTLRTPTSILSEILDTETIPATSDLILESINEPSTSSTQVDLNSAIPVTSYPTLESMNQPSTSSQAHLYQAIPATSDLFLESINQPSTSSTQADLNPAILDTSDPILESINQPSTSSTHADLNPGSKSTSLSRKLKEMQRKCRSLQTKVNKSKKRQLNLQSRLTMARKMLSKPNMLNEVTKNMNTAAKVFTGLQYTQALKKPKGRRYKLDEKIISLSLYKKSPKCYSLLSKYFKLPSKKSLKVLLSDIKIKPGINESVFEKLKDTVGELSNEDCLCTLIFDEMAITPNVQYISNTDELKGFENISDDLKIANHAMVFMIRGINKPFKQPIAYFFTASLKKLELKTVIIDVIKNVQKTGLKVLCTVCDQGATNVSAINSLIEDTRASHLRDGREWRQDYYEIGGQKLIHLYDVPHLMKGLRNNLLTKDLTYLDPNDNEEKIVKWEYFQMLYDADKSSGELRLLHKLTEEHVVPEKIKKMRVKLAVQVFSRSVAVAANNLVDRKKVPQECQNLVPFVLLVDKLFDSLNVNSFYVQNGKEFTGGVRINSPHHKLWRDAIVFLKNLKYRLIQKDGNKIKIVHKSIPSTINFIKTIEGMQELCKNLFDKYSLDCVLTRNFNQDPVENFFGNIRSLGVRNVSPNCSSFEGAFKTLLLNNFSVQHAVNSNCEEDFNVCLQTLEFFIKEKEKIVNVVQNKNIEISGNMVEALSNDPAVDLEDGIDQIEYVCGWVLKKALKNIVKGCAQCKSTIVTTSREGNRYIHAKEYVPNKTWLCYPSIELVSYFKEVQKCTQTYLKTDLKRNNVKDNIKLLAECFTPEFPCTCVQHKENLKKFFLNTTINIIIFSWCKSINRILCGKITYKELDDPIKLKCQQYYNTHKNKK